MRCGFLHAISGKGSGERTVREIQIVRADRILAVLCDIDILVVHGHSPLPPSVDAAGLGCIPAVLNVLRLDIVSPHALRLADSGGLDHDLMGLHSLTASKGEGDAVQFVGEVESRAGFDCIAVHGNNGLGRIHGELDCEGAESRST